MKNFILLFVLTIAFGTFSISLQAQNDFKISVQGTLKDANGAAIEDGPQDVIFKLYTESGTEKWSENATISVNGGVYSHLLGSVEVLDPNDFSEALFLGVTVNGAELRPLTQLTHSPYTLYTPFAGNGVPSGTILPFGGPEGNVPSGFLACDGSAVESSMYPNLSAAIGTAWGDGSTGAGSSTNTDFNLPDLRGMFIRGWDNGAGNDPDAASRTASAAGGNTGDLVGSSQSDENKSHSHTMESGGAHSHTVTDPGHTHSLYTDDNNGATGNGNPDAKFVSSNGIYQGESRSSTTGISIPNSGAHSHSIDNSGGNEARPKNAAVIYIIKY